MRRLVLAMIVLCATTQLWAGKVLIYGPTMDSFVPNEQSLASAAGHSVTVVDASTWSSMTTAQFAAFDAIVFGDPDCTEDTSILSTAISTESVWVPAITGPKVIIGTDPIFHFLEGITGAGQLITNGINFAASGPGTGLYVSLSCYYAGAPSPTTVSLLNGFGSFQVVGQGGCPDSISIVDSTNPVVQGMTNAALSNWGCSMHEWFSSFPSTFAAVAVETSGSPPIRPYIITARGPAIQITLTPAPTNDQYAIDAVPTMPTITAKAKVVGVTPDPTASTTFTWTVTLHINKKVPRTCATGTQVDYDKDIVQNMTTTGDGTFTLTFADQAAFRGGKLQLKASATVNGQTLTGKTPDDLRIDGTNPQRSDVQSRIDASVPATGFLGLLQSDIQDVLKRIACRESTTPGILGQREFDAAANGGVGPVMASCDNGFGIFQITSDDPAVSTPNVLFNWITNVTKGESVYQGKAQIAKQYPGLLKSKAAYRNFITNTINPTRVAVGMRPIPGFPAPSFTTVGIIGSNPPNQLLEDAVRGYNGFAGTADPFGTALHEFIPDTQFLSTVPDNQLPGLDNNPKVWRRVLPQERPSSGDPSYVPNVTAQSPQCGG
jgi:hypothetical protein